jgi:hypothetical protein
MKVLGKSSNTYILEATQIEIANLIGYYYHGDCSGIIIPGAEIQISPMYKQLYNLKENQPELQKIVTTLRNLADSLEPVCPIIEAAIKKSTE